MHRRRQGLAGPERLALAREAKEVTRHSHVAESLLLAVPNVMASCRVADGVRVVVRRRRRSCWRGPLAHGPRRVPGAATTSASRSRRKSEFGNCALNKQSTGIDKNTRGVNVAGGFSCVVGGKMQYKLCTLTCPQRKGERRNIQFHSQYGCHTEAHKPHTAFSQLAPSVLGRHTCIIQVM